jgi:hydroxyethylthiazole kinase-like uncharacterized protein yjeF
MILVTASEMKEMDRRTIESYGIPGQVLMENAGRGATRFLLETFGDTFPNGVAVVAGRGNNGGDGYVIARCLAQKGIAVTVYLLAERTAVTGDAAANLRLLDPIGVPVVELPDSKAFSQCHPQMHRWDLWVDAILGTGLTSDVKEYFHEVIDFINGLNKPVMAVDISSGLNSDTGQPCGICIRASATATFAFAKLGHVVYPGAAFTGALQVVDIGIPEFIVRQVGPRHHLLSADLIRANVHPRAPETHKGRTGHLLVVAGSPGKTGAAAMTAISALRAGAGLVTLAVPQSLNPILETLVLEAMTAPLPDEPPGILGEASAEAILAMASDKKCMALGPGIGRAAQTRALVERLLHESPVPLVIDADGLNHLAGQTRLLKNLKVPVVITPHPGEMSRLLEIPVAAIQQDRIRCARDFATAFRTHVVLKGARTVIAHPDGSVYINPTGNPGMASGGMGDVLTGLIAGLITQGFSPDCAAHTGVYLHGAAADRLARTRAPFGFLAGDVINIIPEEINSLLNPRPSEFQSCLGVSDRCP